MTAQLETGSAFACSRAAEARPFPELPFTMSCDYLSRGDDSSTPTNCTKFSATRTAVA
ncbi:hypothetical protein IF1G_10560 [Cordyceps javanica]|uniref:Uncharacterized protein n=1 Tax=Cordyceps javanica TaxID=43265 RepID=A0A545UMX5_9HYPO|nr:hypothetical protein IF1G_10560 [Cordyceps javanica]